jgi:hypothetical protein
MRATFVAGVAMNLEKKPADFGGDTCGDGSSMIGDRLWKL